MKRIVVLVSVLIIICFSMVRLLECARFFDQFYFSPAALQLRLDDAIQTDQFAPTVMTRFFHNKPMSVLYESVHSYTQFWDVSFLVQFTSIIGVAGMAFGLWYVLKGTNKFIVGMGVIVLLCAPLSIIFFASKIPFYVQFVIVAFLYGALAVYGIYRLFEKPTQWKYILIIGLIGISIWFIYVFPNQYQAFCVIR